MPNSAPGRFWKGGAPPSEQEQDDLLASQNALWLHDGVSFKRVVSATDAAQIATNTADIAAIVATLLGRTALVNPGFEVWQRGAGAFTVDAAYTADRWQIVLGGSSTLSVTRDTVNADGGSLYCAALAYVHNAASYLRQTIEDYGQLRGRTVTFSARVKAGAPVRLAIDTTGAGAYTYGAFHTGGGAYETLTVTAAVAAGATGVGCYVVLGATTTVYVDSATFNVGATATTYVPLHPADDVGRCQRYFFKIGPAATFPHWAGYAAAGTPFVKTLLFPVQMAGVPTLTLGGTWAFINASAFAADSATVDGCRITATATVTGNAAAYSNSSGFLTAEFNPP